MLRKKIIVFAKSFWSEDGEELAIHLLVDIRRKKFNIIVVV